MKAYKNFFRTFSLAKGANILAVLSLTVFASTAHSEWVLDNDKSSLSFVTTKAVDVGEVHYFDSLTGQVDKGGRATLVIDLASVNTGIPIRDERMQNLLFETVSFPDASLSADVPLAQLAELKAGETETITLKGKLGIRGVDAPVTSRASVTKLADGSLQVSSNEPLLINAKDFGLLKGIEKLREVAGLPSIGQSVAVSFQLNFRQ